jgi:PAS domain S-box-containing protein
MKWSVDGKTTVVLTLILFIIILCSFVSYLKIQQLHQISSLLQSTQQTVVEIRTLFSEVKDSHIGQQGYLLTGNKEYLLSYKTAIDKINSKFDSLQALIGDNAKQRHKFNLLKALITAQISEWEKKIKLRQSQQDEAALLMMKINISKNAVINDIRSTIKEMELEAEDLLSRNSQLVETNLQRTIVINAAGCGLILLFGVTSFRKLNYVISCYLESEKARENNHMFWQQLAENLTIVFWMCDVEENRVVYISPAYEQIWGRTCESLYEDFSTFIQSIYPDDRAKVITNLRENVKKHFDMEYRIVRSDGNIRWINVHGFPIQNQAGEIYRQAGFAQDITENKEQKTQIQQLNKSLEQRVRKRTNQLEEANRQLEAFAYSASHDLQEPLRIIQGFALAILEDYANQQHPTAVDYLHRIVNNAQHMEHLIRNLLDYSRLSNQEILLQPVSLALIVSDSLKHLNLKITEKQANITVQEFLPVVMGNYFYLVQTVTNLLSNAIKFVAPGVLAQIKIYTTEESGYVRLWVEDNAIGIPPESKERIFEVFNRLHGSDVYSGTGIGLAIVRKAMERMGGRSGVESVVKQGSRFWIELPILKNYLGEVDN